MSDGIAPAYLSELTLADIAIRILALRRVVVSTGVADGIRHAAFAAYLCQLQDEYRRREGVQ